MHLARRDPITKLPDLPPLDDVVRDHIQTVIDACDGNQAKAARVLCVPLRTLYRYTKKWNLRCRRVVYDAGSPQELH